MVKSLSLSKPRALLDPIVPIERLRIILATQHKSVAAAGNRGLIGRCTSWQGKVLIANALYPKLGKLKATISSFALVPFTASNTRFRIRIYESQRSVAALPR